MIVNVPVLVPPALGSKKTPIVQLLGSTTGLVQLLMTPKFAGLAVTETIVRGAKLLVLVTVTVCGRPLVPTYCPGKVTVVGEKLAPAPGGAGPLPLRVIISGLSAALSVMYMYPPRAPVAVGVKST